MTASSSNSSPSLASDLCRIVLLGIAFDVSRYVAREVLEVLSASRVHDGGHQQADSTSRKERDVVEPIEKKDNLYVYGIGRGTHDDDVPKKEKGETYTTNDEDILAAPSASGRLVSAQITKCLRFHLGKLKRQFYTNFVDKRSLRLYFYLLLPPPLLIYGAWNALHRKNGNNQFSMQNLRGMYLSSVISSLGLLLFVNPEENTREDDDGDYDDDANEKRTELIHSSNPTEHTQNLKERSLSKEKKSADSLTKISPVPSAVLRPPLPPNSTELERRPRSDSLRSMISECSMVPPTLPLVAEKDPKKYLEILVHNVSHTDLVLGLSGDDGLKSIRKSTLPVPFPAEFEDTPRKNNTSPQVISTTCEQAKKSSVEGSNDEKYIMCRPRFSAFDLFTRRVLSELQGQIESTSAEELNLDVMASAKHPLHQKIISYPRYERSGKTARYTLVTPRPSDQYMLPVGFNLERAEGINNTAVDPCEMPNLRLRGRDIPKVDPYLLGETPRRMLNVPTQQLETIPSPEPLTEEQLAGMQTPRRDSTQAPLLRINAVFFPLLATLLPRWLGQIADKFGDDEDNGGQKKKAVAAPLPSPNVKKVVVLVSGVGTPRNWTHSISGNSTAVCAELMELFIHVLYPDITVVRIHSETNIFRYDENITFATQELMPCIDSYRDAHARSEPYPDEITVEKALASSERHAFNPDWRQSVSVTYSFADGSAARSHAIQAALRPYRPAYFHFWQLKTFWHESKITDEDIEVHSFEEMETVPAMAVDQTSETVMMVVNEMKAFRKDFIETLKNGGRSDLKSFWLRKTKKPVLAVLLVEKPGGKHVLYRGTNMEVSMPTGSLCAERNVIGTALANDPGLKREDLTMVAVLSVQLPEEPTKRYAPPPGPLLCRPVASSSAKGGEDFAKEVEDKLNQHQAQGVMRRTASTSSFASIAENGPQIESSKPAAENDDWEMDAFQPDMSPGQQYLGMSPLTSPLLPSSKALHVVEDAIVSPPKAKEAVLIPELNLAKLSEASPSSTVSGSSTPKRRISLYQKKTSSKLGGGVKKQKQSLLVQSLEDMNPLKPCGACNEWLKKIAESNPHFKVLTFTDTKCNGVYVSPCQD